MARTVRRISIACVLRRFAAAPGGNIERHLVTRQVSGLSCSSVSAPRGLYLLPAPSRSASRGVCGLVPAFRQRDGVRPMLSAAMSLPYRCPQEMPCGMRFSKISSCLAPGLKRRHSAHRDTMTFFFSPSRRPAIMRQFAQPLRGVSLQIQARITASCPRATR